MYYIYERFYDLTKYSQDILKKYDLEQGYYVYIGCSKEKDFRERCEKWKSHITVNYHVSYKIVNFIEKYKKFLENETDLSYKEINRELFYKANIELKNISDKNVAKLKESILVGITKITEELNEYETYRPKYFLLNEKDSILLIENEKVYMNKRIKEIKNIKFVKSSKLKDYITEERFLNS